MVYRGFKVTKYIQMVNVEFPVTEYFQIINGNSRL